MRGRQTGHNVNHSNHSASADGHYLAHLPAGNCPTPPPRSTRLAFFVSPASSDPQSPPGCHARTDLSGSRVVRSKGVPVVDGDAVATIDRHVPAALESDEDLVDSHPGRAH